MLPPDSRAVLIQELRPPVGYTLDGAIATTFTLDLTAAVIPPLAFSSFAISSRLPDPVTALEAVRAAAAKVDIFCQGGNISIPNRAPDLLAFVEPMVHAVQRPAGHLFHPKVWFVRYVDDAGNESYRLLVLTRNLTNDHAWDIVVRLDSAHLSPRRLPENGDLHRLLESLPNRAVTPLPTARLRRIEELARAAQYVVWERPEGVAGLSLHYLDGKKRLDFTGRRHLVVSPFLNDAGLDTIVPRTQNLTVVSRAEELERLTPEQLERLDTYVIDAMAGIDLGDGTEDNSGEPPSSAAAPLSLISGLHAKMFVVEPEGRAQRARLLIGSANATDAAMTGNVEFLVEFEGPRRHFGIDSFIGEAGSFRALVEPYVATGGAEPSSDEDERRELENRLRIVAEVQHTLTVQPSSAPAENPNGRFDLLLTTNRPYPLHDGWAAGVELLTQPGVARHPRKDEPLEDLFHKVETADISPFLSIRMTSPSGIQAGTVVLAILVGEPTDRLDLVLARQIDTPEKFLRFLYLILSLGNPHFLSYLSDGNGEGGSLGVRPGGPGVLELVLRALADKPDALDDLGRLVTRLSTTEEGRKLLPAGFEELWAEAERARRALARRRS